jgi:hypothetical protein
MRACSPRPRRFRPDLRQRCSTPRGTTTAVTERVCRLAQPLESQLLDERDVAHRDAILGLDDHSPWVRLIRTPTSSASTGVLAPTSDSSSQSLASRERSAPADFSQGAGRQICLLRSETRRLAAGPAAGRTPTPRAGPRGSRPIGRAERKRIYQGQRAVRCVSRADKRVGAANDGGGAWRPRVSSSSSC